MNSFFSNQHAPPLKHQHFRFFFFPPCVTDRSSDKHQIEQTKTTEDGEAHGNYKYSLALMP